MTAMRLIDAIATPLVELAPQPPAKKTSEERRALSHPLPSNYSEREIEIAIANFKSHGSSILSSARTLLVARERMRESEGASR